MSWPGTVPERVVLSGRRCNAFDYSGTLVIGGTALTNAAGIQRTCFLRAHLGRFTCGEQDYACAEAHPGLSVRLSRETVATGNRTTPNKLKYITRLGHKTWKFPGPFVVSVAQHQEGNI